MLNFCDSPKTPKTLGDHDLPVSTMKILYPRLWRLKWVSISLPGDRRILTSDSPVSLETDGWILTHVRFSGGYKPRFTLGVRANFQSNSTIPIGAKVEISPNGFTLGVKAEREKKNLFNLPQVTKLYGLVSTQGWKKRIPLHLGSPICNLWGQCSNIY